MWVIETDRLRLRAFRLEDAEAADAFYADPVVMRWMGAGTVWTPPGDPGAGVRRVLARHPAGPRRGLWAVEDRAGELIGHGLVLPWRQTGRVELGWLLRRDRWGQGLGTELGRALRAHAHRDAPTVWAFVHPDNRASQRVAEGIGLRRDGWIHAHGVAAWAYRGDEAAPPKGATDHSSRW